MTEPEIIEALELLPHTINGWRDGYRDYWHATVARAVEVAAVLQNQLAGTPAALGDPDRFMAQTRVCERIRPVIIPDVPLSDAMTLSELYESYYKPARLKDAAPQTVTTYKLVMEKWRAFTADPPLRDITVKTLTRFRDCIARMAGRNRVRRCSTASVHQYLMHVQAILDKAGPPGPRNRDAADIIARPPWIKRPRLDVAFPQIATLDQLDALYRSCVSADKPRLPGIKPPAWWRALLAVALGTGLRRRTLFEMRMEHIDWDKHLIIIPAKHLKTRKPQIVCLSHVALDHLRTIRTDRELVFPWPHTQHTFYQELHRLQTLAGINFKDQFGLHRIRKTTATLLWESNPQAAQLALGHSTDRVTRAYYVAGQGIMAKALDAMPLPAAFTEGANGNGDAGATSAAGNGQARRAMLDQLTTLLRGLGIPDTTQLQIAALAARRPGGPRR